MRRLSAAEGGPLSSYYDAEYFGWQKAIGEFGGWADLPKFAPYVASSDSVLDFGCGGGHLLRNLACARRIGVEINAAARDEAGRKGIEVYASASSVPDSCADKIISNHALEHTREPLVELVKLHAKLREGGAAIFVIPCETIAISYSPTDVNRHLYSWSPMSLANLFVEAGFRIIHSRPYLHKWPPFHRTIARIGGRAGFEIASRLYGNLARSSAQVHLVAMK